MLHRLELGILQRAADERDRDAVDEAEGTQASPALLGEVPDNKKRQKIQKIQKKNHVKVMIFYG